MKRSRRLLLRASLLTAALVVGLVVMAVLGAKIEPLFRPKELTFDEHQPRVGEIPPDFSLRDLEDRPFHLQAELRSRPLVIEFGSVTCPYCTRQFGSLDTLAQKYADRADFIFIYCKEAHPYQTIAIDTYGKRVEQAKHFSSLMKARQRILVDDFEDGSVQQRYGALEYSVFVLDREGKLWKKFAIATPSSVEEALRECLGEPPVNGTRSASFKQLKGNAPSASGRWAFPACGICARSPY